MKEQPVLCVVGSSMHWAIIALLFFFPAGCADRAPSRFAGLPPAEARTVAMHLAQSRDAQLRDDLQSAFAHHSPTNVLVLSGGDAHGAFGCGVLSGWRRSTNNPRPQFDVVTGVSTGALMATFAFLGQPQDDESQSAVYLHVRDKDIYQGPLSGPPDAVFDTAPLRRLIAHHITADVLRRVAAAHREGRRLYVATVELDTGALFIWPMSRLANDAILPNGEVSPSKLDKFRTILLAAASIPIFFPPVEIDGGLHVDAGLRAALFIHEAMLGVTNTIQVASTNQPAAATSSPATVPPTVWVIFCGQLGINPRPVEADVLHIGTRSLDVFTSAVEILSIRQAAYMAAAHNPAYRFRWISEPPTDSPQPTAPGLLEPMFDPKTMARLYQTGQRLASTNQAWQEGPPPMETLGTN